jgi:hypothetical protein
VHGVASNPLSWLRANVLQTLFAELIRIALTGFGKGNDLIGDGLLDIVAQSPVRRATQAICRGGAMARVVSASNFSPFRNGVIGIAGPLATPTQYYTFVA